MATETLVLDGVTTATNLSGATVANLNAIDANWAAVVDSASGTELIATMPSPTGNPTSGAGLQTFRVEARKSATGGSVSTFTIAVREGGVDLATSASHTVTATTGTTFDFTWDASLLSDPTGAGVEVHLVGAASGGKPADRRSVGYGYVAWLADYAEAAAPITGTMAGSETGTDTFAATGTVTDPTITGALAAQETGSDTFAATGTVADPAITGTLAATESGNDTATIAGTLAIAGVLSATESGSDAAAGSGSVAVQGALNATETGTDDFTASGALGSGISGTLAATEIGADSFAATGSVAASSGSGTMAATESGTDTFTASGTLAVVGTLAAQEASNDNFTATGSVALTAITGTLAATESGTDTFRARESITLPAVETISRFNFVHSFAA